MKYCIEGVFYHDGPQDIEEILRLLLEGRKDITFLRLDINLLDDSQISRDNDSGENQESEKGNPR